MVQQLLAYGLAGLCILVTLLPFHRGETWWVRACDFPRAQIAILTAATLAGILAFTEMNALSLLLAFALLGCLGIQLAVILPYTRLWPVEVKRTTAQAGPRTLSLMIANVLMQNRSVDRLKQIIWANDPDLVLAVETDQWWCAHLEGALPHHPFRIAHPLPNTYGMLLLSRLELMGPEVRFLLKRDIPSIRTGVRLRSGEVVTFYGLHPEPPAPGEAETSLPRDAELVLAGREIADTSHATIVAGDFNDVAWSHTSRLFRRISRLRPTCRTGHVQYFPRALLVPALAARPRLRQRHVPAARPEAPACLRFRPFSHIHRARSCAGCQRGAGGAATRCRRPGRSAGQAHARRRGRGRLTGAAVPG